MTDTNEALLKEVRELFQKDVDADRENRDAGLEDIKFACGETQWDESARQARKGRPCLTINRLPQFIAQVVGDIRINRPAIKVRPAEDADKKLADVREGLIRAIERQSSAQDVYANAGTAQVTCGIGNFRVALAYADGDVFERDIMIERIPDPFSVVWDCMAQEPTGRDAQHCFVVTDMDRKAFEATYKRAQSGGLEVATDATWVTRDIVKVVEYWRIKETEVELAQLADGRVVEASKAGPNQIVATRKRMRKSVCMTLMTGFDVLEKTVEWPITRIPIFRVPGWEMMIGSRRVRWGLVRFAKDAQRLKNYWRSVAAEVLALAPRAQWLLNTGQGGTEPDSVEDFRNAAKSGDPVLEYQGQTVPQRVDPPPVPVALLQEAQLCDQDMKDVTGIQDASLGMRSNETSGKAILARQREGDVANFIYSDNLKSAITECGRVVNDLIPYVYDTKRTIRVVGEDGTTTLHPANDPLNEEAIDLTQGKYDIAVDVGPAYSTKRVEAAESMMQFVQAFPQVGQVAGDLIAKAQDWPMAEEIGERIKATLPPELVKDKDAEPSPEQQQAMQAQQQQAQQMQEMQQGAMQLDMMEKQASVRKAEADAAISEANAAKAQLEAVASHGVVDLQQAEIRLKNAQADQAEAMAVKAMAEAQAAGANAHVAHVKADSAEAMQKAELKAKTSGPKSPASSKPATGAKAA